MVNTPNFISVGRYESGSSNIVKIKPKEHDKVFSYLSHLPHALSFCLNKVAVKRLGAKKVKVFGGTSYMDYSWISSRSENLRSDIFLSNKDNLASSIDDWDGKVILTFVRISFGNINCNVSNLVKENMKDKHL